MIVIRIVLHSIDDGSSDLTPEVTALKFTDDGLGLIVGTSSGVCLIYDLRTPQPLMMKDHQYGYPIKDIKCYCQDRIISSDKKIMKIWDKNDGKLFTSIEPESDINDICVHPNSGLVMMATEQPKIQTYYIPELGPAPKWCSFLDSITEELEESKHMLIYDDYKFVTRKDLEELGLDHLIGTNLLRAYMHGFFIDLRLYEKAKSITNPFAYEEYRENMIRAKLEKERESRIVFQKKSLPKINRKMAEKWSSTPDDSKQIGVNPLKDQRFAEMFSNPEFEIDEESRDFKLMNPSRSMKQIVRDAFEEVNESDSVSKDSGSKGSIRQDRQSKTNITNASSKHTHGTGRQPKFYQLKVTYNFLSFQIELIY
jgi:ribosome biogenesis protein ENP2